MAEVEAVLGDYHVRVATDFGPRITGLRLHSGPEMFVSLPPAVTLEHPARPFVFRGGHRLWAAPEDPGVTYAPDDHPCDVKTEGQRLVVTAPPDLAGFIKELVLTLDDGWLVVEHRLGVVAGDVREAAPWAITQVPLGGTAILVGAGGDTGPLPNRNLVLWPYTSISDGRITLGDERVLISAVGGNQLKVGAGPAPGRVGYLREGWLFLKVAEVGVDGRVPDFGAAGQVYLGRGFCELETVGSIRPISAGSPARHVERWSVTECANVEAAVEMAHAR